MALTEVNSTSIKDGTLVNADVNASAAIALSKLSISGTGSSSNYLRGDGSWQTISTGDGLTLANGADNRVVTATGAAALNGESTLTFDSGLLSITGNSAADGLRITNDGDHYTQIKFDADRSSAGDALGIISGLWNNTEVGAIYLRAGNDTTNKDDGVLSFYTAAAGSIAERLRIDSSGRLLIGATASQDVYTTSTLQIQGTTAATSTMSLLGQGRSPYLSLGATGGSSLGSVTAVSSGDRLGQITFCGADGTDVNTHSCSVSGYCDGSVSGNAVPGRLVFKTSTGASEVERMRIESDGKVRIGNTTENQYTAADNLIVGSGSGDNGLTIYSGSSDAGLIAFSDGTTDTAYRSGQIIYSHSADSMIFRTNGNYTRLTIDSTGIVDVTGKLRVDISTTGGAGAGTAEGIFLRNTNETDNNAVSIFGGADDYGAAASAINFINVDHSANAGNISFDTRTTGNAYAQRLLIGTDKVMFSVDAKVDSDNARDLGTAATRWKDLYLAGDVHVASGKGIDFSATADGNATDTSELLDDYEEGTWTPVASRSTGGAISGSYGSQQGKYIKVGNLVTVEYYVQISSVSSQGSGLLMIDGLPYSPTSAYQNSGAVFFNNCVDNDYVRAMTAHSDFGGCIYYVTDQKGDSLLSADWEGGYIGGTLTYTTGL